MIHTKKYLISAKSLDNVAILADLLSGFLLVVCHVQVDVPQSVAVQFIEQRRLVIVELIPPIADDAFAQKIGPFRWFTERRFVIPIHCHFGGRLHRLERTLLDDEVNFIRWQRVVNEVGDNGYHGMKVLEIEKRIITR